MKRLRMHSSPSPISLHLQMGSLVWLVALRVFFMHFMHGRSLLASLIAFPGLFYWPGLPASMHGYDPGVLMCRRAIHVSDSKYIHASGCALSSPAFSPAWTPVISEILTSGETSCTASVDLPSGPRSSTKSIPNRPIQPLTKQFQAPWR